MDKQIEEAAEIFTPEQLTALPLLACGKTQDEVADLIGVRRKTIWRWLNQEEFAAEFKRLKAENYDRAIAAAISMLEGQITDSTGKIAAKDKAYAAGHLLKHHAMVQAREQRVNVRFEGLEKIRQALGEVEEPPAIPAEFSVEN